MKKKRGNIINSIAWTSSFSRLGCGCYKGMAAYNRASLYPTEWVGMKQALTMRELYHGLGLASKGTIPVDAECHVEPGCET